MILIKKLNEIFVKITAEKSILKEIEGQFKFRPDNYRFDPRYGHGWDGYVKLFTTDKCQLYIGILDKLISFLSEQNYEYKIEGNFSTQNFSDKEALDFIKTLNLPKEFEVRDYQLKYFVTSVRNQRTICISPTSSGKSLLLYLLYRYFNKKTLIIVPTIQLVSQMYKDFKSYGYEGDAHLITGGVEKETNKQLIISTYQSIYDLPKDWFADKEIIFGDECLHPNTEITMYNMSKKKIKDIKAGDLVKTLNEKTLEIESKIVKKIHKNISLLEKKYKITTIDNNELIISGNHKIFTQDGWKRVDELKNDDMINTFETM